MLIRLFSLLIVCFSLIQVELNASKMHALIVADTLDPSIGDSVYFDFRTVIQKFRRFAWHTGQQFMVKTLSGEEVIPDRMIQLIKSIEIEPDDTVIFFFAGHGYHLSSQKGSRWPALYFSITNEGILLSDILEEIQNKNPRLTVMLSDSCNNILKDHIAPSLVAIRAYSLFKPSPQTIEAYKRLFLYPRGVVIGVAAIEGAYASGTSLGGFFTNAFFEEIIQEAEKERCASWTDVMLNTERFLNGECQQQMDFSINVDLL